MADADAGAQPVDESAVLDDLVRSLSKQIASTGWVEAEQRRLREAGAPILNVFEIAAAAAAATSVAAPVAAAVAPAALPAAATAAPTEAATAPTAAAADAPTR
jgi:hypothetical protein